MFDYYQNDEFLVKFGWKWTILIITKLRTKSLKTKWMWGQWIGQTFLLENTAWYYEL